MESQQVFDPVEGLTFDEAEHRYYYHGERVPNVTTIIREAAESDPYEHVPEGVLQAKADLGTRVHKAVERFHAGESGALEAYDGEKAGNYLAAYRSFVDHPMLDIEVLASEYRLIHTHYRYAGTLDLMLWLDGQLTLVDIKTTASMDPEPANIQTGAYEMAWNGLHPGYGVEDRRVLFLRPNGTFRLRTFDDPDAGKKEFRRRLSRFQPTVDS